MITQTPARMGPDLQPPPFLSRPPSLIGALRNVLLTASGGVDSFTELARSMSINVETLNTYPNIIGDMCGSFVGVAAAVQDVDLIWRYVYDDGTTPVDLVSIAKTALTNIPNEDKMFELRSYLKVRTIGAGGKIWGGMRFVSGLTGLTVLNGFSALAGVAVTLTKSGYFQLRAKWSTAATDLTAINVMASDLRLSSALIDQG